MNEKSSSDRQIQDLIKRQDYARAESLVRHRLALDPEDADAYYLRGVLSYFQGQVPPTIENLKRALQIDPRHTDAAICLSVLYNDIGKYDDAKAVFDQANQSVSHFGVGHDQGIDQKFAVKHLELADLYFRYRRHEEAIEEYSKAALLDPSSLDIRIRLAKAYAKKGFLSRAVQELQRIKADHPDFIPARIQLGLLHFSQGNLLDAELEWESVLGIDPTHREALSYLEMARENRPNN